MNNTPLDWYLNIPVVSRVYLTGCLVTTALCALDILSPFSLYFNANLISSKWQFWRLFTTFFYFGDLGLDFLFHMYFTVRYCRLLEENSFQGRTLDFLLLFLYGIVVLLLIAPFLKLLFLGPSFTFMLSYIWGRRNEHVRMSFMGLFTFNAPYLPFVLLIFSLAFGHSAVMDIIGIATGHVYYYLDDVYPEVARIRGWKPKHYLRSPEWLKSLVGFLSSRYRVLYQGEMIGIDNNEVNDDNVLVEDLDFEYIPAESERREDDNAVSVEETQVISNSGEETGGNADQEGSLGDKVEEHVITEESQFLDSKENGKSDVKVSEPEDTSASSLLKTLHQERLRRRRSLETENED